MSDHSVVIEWGVRWTNGTGHVHVFPQPDEATARHVASEHGLVIDGRELVSRTLQVGPWAPVRDA